MSPRPRSASNDDILDGVMRAIARVGPARLALTDVAEETGLAPATLIQRFGSKRGILLAALERGIADTGRRLSEIRAQQQSPLAALVAVAADAAGQGSSPVSVANHLRIPAGQAGRSRSAPARAREIATSGGGVSGADR